MADPFRTLLNLTDGKRHYIIDSDHVTQEDFETTAIIADVIWGHEGLAEMLGSTWRMVHDPRFAAVERCGIYEQKNMFSPGAKAIGQQVIRSQDLFSQGVGIEDMSIYAEVLGEGRHFKEIVIKRGWDPAVALTETQIWDLIRAECPNYQRRNGTWNRAAETLADLFRAGLISLVHDYADIPFCVDWIRMDTQEVVEPGQRLKVADEDGVEIEEDTPVIAIEVENLFKALTFRAQVRITAYKLLKQFPGIKAEDLENLTFTDLESDNICQILFNTAYDKLYTAMPALIAAVRSAASRSFEERQQAEVAKLTAESKDFNAKLRSGEIEQIKTPIEEASSDDPAVFMVQLMHNPYYAGLFQGLQTLEARGDEAAATLCQELVTTRGAGDVWERVRTMVESSKDSQIDLINLKNAAAVHGVEWKERSTASEKVLGDGATTSTTTVETVFTGEATQTFHFIYLNPHADPHGHHTAIVDIQQADGSFARRTWSIAPEQWKQIADAVPNGTDVTRMPWTRTIDHSLGQTLIAPVPVENPVLSPEEIG